MPGFHIFHSISGTLKSCGHIPDASHLLHDAGFSESVLFTNTASQLSFTAFEEYPRRIIETDQYFILAEGYFYPAASVTDTILIDIAAKMISGDESSRRQLTEWLKSTDGDFVIVVRDKQHGRWALLNDVLGRLPVYLYHDEEKILISRELRYISGQIRDAQFDKIALSQYLLFGFPVAERTLLKDVRILPHATLLTWRDVECKFLSHQLYIFNYDDKNRTDSFKVQLDGLLDSFIESCRNQIVSGGPTVLSLSGGLDSRAVAFGLQRGGCEFNTVTYQYKNGGNQADVQQARQLAELLKVPWDLVKIPSPTGAEIKHLLNLKGGMNFTAMAFLISFLERTREKYGRSINYFTGDGGDKILPDARPPKKLRSASALVHYIVERNDVLNIERVAALVGLDTDAIYHELMNMINGYPEQSLTQKYVHFVIHERGRKWLYEGEDRNRFYFWSRTPFYSRDFFLKAMRCPDSFKKGFTLYRAFLDGLSPEASRIVDSNHGIPITSPMYTLRTYMFSMLARYPKMSRKLKRSLNHTGHYTGAAPIITCLNSQIKNCAKVSHYFDTAALEHLLADSPSVPRIWFDNLFTLISTIESLNCNSSTLNDYTETIFE
ncbi:MAG: asparagine synthase-related protein [Candidatus Zixiibacteriota bacterium]